MKTYDLVAVVAALPWSAGVGPPGTVAGYRVEQAVVEAEGAGFVVPLPLVGVGVIVPPAPGGTLVLVVIGGLQWEEVSLLAQH